MPYLKEVKTDRLYLPSDPAYWVDMKLRASGADIELAQRATMELTQTERGRLNGHQRGIVVAQHGGVSTRANYDGGAYLPTLVICLIVDWNLDGPQGKLPIDRDSLRLLDAADIEYLQNEAEKRKAVRSADEQEDFTMPSSESSPLGAATPKTRKRPVS